MSLAGEAPAPSPARDLTRKDEAAGLSRRFGENLLLLRGRTGISRGTIIERSGLHITHISLLERGLRMPRLDTIVKLAGAFGVEPCELLAGMAWRIGRSVERPGAYVQQGAFEVGVVDRREAS